MCHETFFPNRVLCSDRIQLDTRTQYLALLEDLRIPLNDAHSPMDWKDWYHFVLFDPDRKYRVLANVSLSGRPGRGQITVTVLATIASASHALPQSFGFLRDYEWHPGAVTRAPVRVHTEGGTCTFEAGQYAFNAREGRIACSLELTGSSVSDGLHIPEPAPVGDGFVGWGLVPLVRMQGRLRIGDRIVEIGPDWYGYHDHNYGRFRWGSDVGWIWMVMNVPSSRNGDTTFVLHQGVNRQGTRFGPPYLFVFRRGKMAKVFTGDAVRLKWTWSKNATLPVRLPGVMASVFADRSTRVPTRLAIAAADEKDAVSMTMPIENVLELILPDNEQRQYTCIEELSGTAEVMLRIGQERITGYGSFYAEYVH
jgi:hypothetical protein